MRAPRLIGWVVVACLSVSGCTVFDGPSTQSAGPDLNGAYGDLVGNINDYLGIQRETFEQDPERFFSEGKELIAQIRDSQAEWEEAVAELNLPAEAHDGIPSEGTVEEFNAALDQWIAAQEEQAAMSQDCWMSLDRNSCYASMIGTNSARWNEIGARINAAMQTLSTEARE